MAIENEVRSETNDILNNPFIGWAPWAEYGPYPQPHRLVYAPLLWSELEPVKNTFAWSAFEAKQKFSYWASKGVRIVLRFISDYPGSSTHMDIPKWLYQEINEEGTWYGSGFSPNYSNQAMISNHQRVMNALGQRYNNDPQIAFIEIGSIGQWGEFHTYNVSPGAAGYMPPIPVSDQYVTHYLNAFPNKKLLMRRPFQIAKDNGLGLYDDMFGNPEETERFIRYFTSGYSSSGQNGFAAGTYPAMPDFWKVGPSGGELGDSPGLVYLTNASIQRTIQYARSSYTSWLGPACPASQPVGSSLQANMDSLLLNMGYRFVLTSESHPASIAAGNLLNVTMQWTNRGVAPFYYKWPLELSLSDSSGSIALKATTPEDIRTWMPGSKNIVQTMAIPQTLAAGTYTLCVAIIDPSTGAPGVDLAMTGRRTDGRYAIGQVTITDAVIPPADLITIDGNVSDWSSIAVLGVPSILTSLKMTNDAGKLYFCVQGIGLNVKSSFYLNTDNNTATGYQVPGWTSAGCEFLLANDQLYRYIGAGTNVSWDAAGSMAMAKTDTVIEAAIPLAMLGLTTGSKITAGYVMNDSEALRIPGTGRALLSYTVK